MSEALNKVNEKIKSLAAAFETAISFDDDGAAVVPETFVKDHLAMASGSEELTMETVQLVQDTEANFVSGAVLGLGNASLPHMKKHKDLARTTATLQFGSNQIRAAVDRTLMVRAPGASEEKAKAGVATAKLDSGASAKRGDLKRVITHIHDSFTAGLGK